MVDKKFLAVVIAVISTLGSVHWAMVDKIKIINKDNQTKIVVILRK